MKKKFVLIGIFLTLLVALFAVVFTASAASREHAAKLEGLRAAARQTGLPTTMDEVPYQSAPPDDNNAAPLILQAAERLDVDKELTANLMYEASLKRDCVFPWEEVKEAGFWTRLRFEECAEALIDHAERALEADNLGEFTRSIKAATTVLRMVAWTPTADAFRESVNAERRLYERMGDWMLEHAGHSYVMESVQDRAFDGRNTKEVLVALREFFAMGNEVAQNREIDGDQRVSWIWSRGDFPTDPWGRDAVEARHLEESIKLAKEIDKASTWPQVMDLLHERTAKWEQDESPAAYTLRELGKTIRDLGQLGAENEAARRILFVSAGAFRHRLEHRAFPSKSPIIGEMNFDPFTNKPLVFSNPGSGFFVYSFGADREDASGETETGLAFGHDICFTCKGVEQTSATQQSTPR